MGVPRHWLVLLALTLARTTMGFQFQSLAVAGPVLISESAISYAALGALIGAYLLPGALFSLPGGWLGKRFGDKRVVLSGLAMMICGGALLAASQNYSVMLAGRLVSGVGAVLLNVLVTKMATDWFAGKRIVTAMGILISSWPLGIAIALLAIGPLVDAFGPALAFTAPIAACAIALLLVTTLYTSPVQASAGNAETAGNTVQGLTTYEFRGVLLSGCVWCFYNVAFILPLSFGPEFLTSKGMSVATAGAMVSLATWLIIPALATGGWLTEHIGRPTTTMLVCFGAIAVVTWMMPATSSYATMFAILGVMFGIIGGLIMTLPAQVLRKENRAVGMGIFFTVYYIGMGIFPAFAGFIRDASGNPAAPFWFAVLMIFMSMISLIGLRVLQRIAGRPIWQPAAA